MLAQVSIGTGGPDPVRLDYRRTAQVWMHKYGSSQWPSSLTWHHSLLDQCHRHHRHDGGRAVITARQSLPWSIFSTLLDTPQISRREVIATLSRTVLLIFTGMHGPLPFYTVHKDLWHQHQCKPVQMIQAIQLDTRKSSPCIGHGIRQNGRDAPSAPPPYKIGCLTIRSCC